MQAAITISTINFSGSGRGKHVVSEVHGLLDLASHTVVGDRYHKGLPTY